MAAPVEVFGRRPRRARRARGRRGPVTAVAGSLRFLVVKVMGDGGSLRVPELVARLHTAAYAGRASERNLRLMAVKILDDRGTFRRVRRGLYRLAGAAPVVAPAGRRGRKPVGTAKVADAASAKGE